MKKLSKLLMILIINFSVIIGAKAYQHEVWKSGSQYYWKTFNVTRGHSSDLATAIQGAISSGNREVHIWTSGTLSKQIDLKDGLTLRCHGVSFARSHSGYGFYGYYVDNVKIYDISITSGSGMGIRTTGCSNLRFEKVNILAGGIGLRVDSHSSRPWDNHWVYNLTVQDCRFENLSEHGLETYAVNGLSVYGIVCRNNGGCGVLFNKSKNGSVGTVNSYRCCYGGGYAGLRFANDCDGITVSNCISDKCGRGLFILTGSKNITVNCCQITACSDIGIWFQDAANCKVKSGCVNCGWAITGSSSGSSISVQGYCSGFSCSRSAEDEVVITSDESIGRIYPTTVENILNIKLSEEMENGSSLRVYNSTGKLVYSTQLLNKDNSIDLSTLSNGIYFVSVSNGQKDLNQKIIKK